MERQDVFAIINEERIYQDTVRRDKEQDVVPDHEKSVADFVLFMQHHLDLAKDAVYELNKWVALDEIRKVAGLAVAVMEAHGAPRRIID